MLYSFSTVGSSGRGHRRYRETVMFTRTILIALLCVFPVFAQDTSKPNADRRGEEDPAKRRRLEAVSWNPVTGLLTWTVSNGHTDEGKYVADGGKKSYEIDLQQAIMSHNGSQRRFSSEEARNVMTIMHVISKYAQDSTVWWDAGKGQPVGQRVSLEGTGEGLPWEELLQPQPRERSPWREQPRERLIREPQPHELFRQAEFSPFTAYPEMAFFAALGE